MLRIIAGLSCPKYFPRSPPGHNVLKRRNTPKALKNPWVKYAYLQGTIFQVKWNGVIFEWHKSRTC